MFIKLILGLGKLFTRLTNIIMSSVPQSSAVVDWLAGWLAAGWLLAGCWLLWLAAVAGCWLLASVVGASSCWLVFAGWLAAEMFARLCLIYLPYLTLLAGWLACCWLAGGLAGCLLASWLAGCLAAGWLADWLLSG
jgi:hypothetical protein